MVNSHSCFTCCLISRQWQQEPNNVAGIENCGVLRMTGNFSSRDCTSRANYACFKQQYSGR